MDTGAMRLRSAGDEARLAARLNAAADGVPTAGDSGLAGVDLDGETDVTDRRRGDGGGRGSGRRGCRRTTATRLDAAADRRSTGGRDPAAEVLGQGALHELGKWIHGSSPMKEHFPGCEEGRDAGRQRGGRRAGRALRIQASPGKERRNTLISLGSPSHRLARNKPDPWRLLRDMSMDFFSLMGLRILPQSRGGGIALEPLRHSSVILRRGMRRFRYGDLANLSNLLP
jgi:hypothetical protein